MLSTVERLAARLKTTLAARGDGARRIELALFRTDGAVKRIAAGTSRPTRDPRRSAPCSSNGSPRSATSSIRASASISPGCRCSVAEPCPDEQIGLGGSEDPAELDRLVDRLSARLGRRRVAGSSPTTAIFPSSPPPRSPRRQPREADSAGMRSAASAETQAELGPRPLRLLARPEPIEVIAVVPDGPPVRFRWRRACTR